MAKLIYTAMASLDGYVEDAQGGFEWAAPDAEVHAFVNDLERPIGTYLYGRRMYETMMSWETLGTGVGDAAEPPAVYRDYADIWRGAEKIVFSRSLPSPATPRTRLARDFDPATVRQLKGSSARDLSVGGAELAGQALAAGLVDEVHFFLNPIIVGGGKRAVPDGVRVPLELRAERRFGSGVVYLAYGLPAREMR